MPSRKPVERQRLDALLECLGLADLSELEDSERPDFLLRIGERTVGVEVTHLVSPRVPGGINPRQTDKVLRRVITATLAAYLAQGGVPVHASIRFRRGIRLTKRAADEFAQRLAPLLVSKIQRAHTRQPHRQPLEVVIDDPDVDHLGAWPCRPGESPEWHPLSGGIVQHATDVDILTTLRPKESKLAAYRARAEEVWLLNVCDLMADGLIIDPPERPVPFGVSTSFDRVFCLAWTGTYAVELPIITLGTANSTA